MEREIRRSEHMENGYVVVIDVERMNDWLVSTAEISLHLECECAEGPTCCKFLSVVYRV
jgi:hypothetical protein